MTTTYDVLIAGAGTGGVVAALASAREGARTAVVEMKGYPGGIAVEGGTALHSFYNLWKAFDVPKRQVISGIPQQIIDRLMEIGACTGHAEMEKGYDYDNVCTAIDTELYKLTALEMLDEAGVTLMLNTMLTDADAGNNSLQSVTVNSHAGKEILVADMFVDATGYGDLCAYAGAEYTEPNDHPVANSIGVAGVSLEKYHEFLKQHNAVTQYCEGLRSGKEGRIVRLDADMSRLPEEFRSQAQRIGMSLVTTSVHDDYFMFIKLNFKMEKSPTDRDAAAAAELELRKRQEKAIRLLRRIPGLEKAFITRTSPSLCIRRGRRIVCDYDITLKDILDARHFDDDVFVYGFHDCAPRLQVKNGGTYGIPYRALTVKGLNNLYTCGMTITSDWDAHMSTRNTVSCMAQGQAVGTAAALCSQTKCSIRDLPYATLRKALEKGNVYFEK